MKPLFKLILCYDLSMVPYALAQATLRPCMVVINPHNGVGKKTDPDYEKWIAASRALSQIRTIWTDSKGKSHSIQTIVLGYLDLVTWRGDVWKIKARQAINQECIRWRDAFTVGGLWLDDCFAREEGFINSVTALRFFAPTWCLVANPGESAPVKLYQVANFVCDYEGNLPSSLVGLPKAEPKQANVIRIAKGTKKTAPMIWKLAELQKLAAVCVTDDMSYQRAPSWERKD